MIGQVRFFRPLRAAYAALAVFLVTGAAGVHASEIADHREMTVRVLRELGWESWDAVDLVARYNAATDFGRLSEGPRTAIHLALPQFGQCVPLVRRIGETAPFSPDGSVGFHFNSLYTFDDIVIRWREFRVWVEAACDWIDGVPEEEYDPQIALCLIGMVSHAVQDFYCHANWVELLDEFTPGDLDAGEFPLWEELVKSTGPWDEANPRFDGVGALARLRLSNEMLSEDVHEGGLQTGRVRGEQVENGSPWMHRHAVGRTQLVVHALARRATALWVTWIERRLDLSPREYRPL